ncbi:MAG: hypothetical protein R3C30_00690 [Hyphomonadaceae bacterium]
MRVELRDDGSADLQEPEGSRRTWTADVLNALGTTSADFGGLALSEIISFIGGEEKCEVHVNAALAVVEGLRPRNEAEALLAVQMVAAHLGAMKSFSYLMRAQQLPQFQVHTEIANKFMRTYATQLEAFARLRRGGEQTVRVEHVHVYSGGQAVVGDIKVSRGGGRREIDKQPHAPGDAAVISSAKMRSENAVGSAVPGPRNSRKKEVSHARGEVSRRAKRKQER